MPEIETQIEIGVPAAGKQWLGTVTAEVVQKADRPVLVLPEGQHLEDIKIMVYATALKQRDLDRIRSLPKLLPTKNALIHIVHVNTEAEKRQISIEDMEKAFAKNEESWCCRQRFPFWCSMQMSDERDERDERNERNERNEREP